MLWTKERLMNWIFGSNKEALEVEKEIMEEEEVDCPIHGKLGGINECPRC